MSGTVQKKVEIDRTFISRRSASTFCRIVVVIALLMSTNPMVLGSFFHHASAATSEDDRFDDFEIRVIRPKFFQKKKRFELGAELTAIMNQTFIYTYLATGLMTYHFGEQIGAELAGSYGISIDKEDKSTLKNSFDIKTQIIRTKFMLGGSLLYTPMYGKYQLKSGRLIYFDTFLSAGAGMTGVEYLYDHCIDPNEDIADATKKSAYIALNGEKPPPKTVTYPTGSIGIGQRLFLSRTLGLRWDVRDYFFSYDLKDGSCSKDAASASQLHNNVTLQLGASKFF